MLLQGGFIWQAGTGLYALLPLAHRVLERLKSLVRQELNAIGAQECVLPAITGRTLWERSGRWSQAGDELFRLQDRKGSSYCLAATHEETITALVAATVSSYRSLPLYIYQIQPKYRDELRPRHGLLRCREFLMKDMYTFDCNEEDAHATYNAMIACYHRILEKLGVPFMVVEADTGLIGGSKSHEFQVNAPIGEDTFVTCGKCKAAANIEELTGMLQGVSYFVLFFFGFFCIKKYL